MIPDESVHAFSAPSLSGAPIDLRQYLGKVILIVNTASKCGFTPQYKELETLYRQLKDQGFVVLGFPCNQFGQQEPGDAATIAEFCEQNYGISFPMFAKIEVNGDAAHPLFKYLKKAAPGLLGSQAIKWNFTKFLVRKDGSVYKRYAPQTRPESLAQDVQNLIRE
ncbi:MAG: glutathione peroxidase [Burkholderiaceae bacterium]